MAKGKVLSISPKIKFKKHSKSISNIVNNQLTFKRTQVFFFRYVVQAASDGLLTARQLETFRVLFKRYFRRFKIFKILVCFKPRVIVTKRSPTIRMGRGKGSPYEQVSIVQKGQLLYEISGPTLQKAAKAFLRCSKKLPVKVNLIDITNGTIT